MHNLIFIASWNQHPHSGCSKPTSL